MLTPDRRNRPLTVKRAKSLRRAMTEAELKLWSRLRFRQLGGCKFRKQVPISPYIADFVHMPLKLIVEVDGGQHDESRSADERRTAWLEARGYRVLRFWNNEVLQNIDGVIEVIARAIGLSID